MERERHLKNLKILSKLAKNNANGNDLLNYHQKLIKADCYFQLFVTSPLIKVSSINQDSVQISLDLDYG